MKIAIDGPAGSGKSTVARTLAKRCNITYLDTGAMYRAVTFACLAAGISEKDDAAVADVAKAAHIVFANAADGTQTVTINQQDVTKEIRTAEVEHAVSAVSAIPAVREAMVSQQRRIAGTSDVVAEGRDIGTVVFPDAEVKIFLTADPSARAHRRAVQREGKDAAQDPTATADASREQAILDELKRRDRLDSTRAVAPLKPAADAHHIDSSHKTVDEVIQEIISYMDEARSNKAQVVLPKAKAASTDADVAKTKNEQPNQHNALAQDKLRAFHGNSFDDYFDAPMSQFPLPGQAFMGLAVGVVGAVTKLLWPWKIEEPQKLWQAQTGRVIVMNHVSMLDPVVVIVSEWMHGRRARAIYKSEFDKTPLVTWIFSRCGAIPVERGTADMKAVRRARKALQQGEDILIYPEGTRIKTDDQPITLHAGFALMAQLAKAPVLPMAIVGARDITTPTRKIPHFHRVFLKVGDPLSFDDLGVKGRKAQCKAMETKAMDAVYALRDELRQEHPGKA